MEASTQSSQGKKKIALVLGNESGDLDSIVSSIARAWHLSQTNPSTDTLYIPVINIKREDFKLRRDAIFLFNIVGLDSKHLLFQEDLERLEHLTTTKKLEIHLVDHHVLTSKQKHLSKYVVTILDHHQDTGMIYPHVKKGDKVIRYVKSASTMILHKIKQDKLTIPSQIAVLLLAPNLIDTRRGDGATEEDREAFEALWDSAKELLDDSTTFYQQLKRAKEDISGFSPLMVLRKDFKKYQGSTSTYGISSFPNGASWWDEAEVKHQVTLQEHQNQEEIDLVFILETHIDEKGDRSRRLILFSQDPSVTQSFVLQVAGDPVLKPLLVPAAKAQSKAFAYFDLTTPLARKKLQPLLG